jgi:predicted dehydrogenase
MKQTHFSRRHFLKQTAVLGATAAAPHILPSSVFGAAARPSPSNRVTIGMVGVGGHGVAMNMRSFLANADAQIVAVCDVDSDNCKKAQKIVNQRYGNEDCATYGDFREVIARKDIDAICVSTPDHWHVPISLMAIRAGKDVISEKPTLTIEEGRVLTETVKRHGAIFQTSTEDRGLPVYHRMAELVRNGRIGKLQTIRVGLPSGGGRDIPLERQQPEPVPPTLDYDLWLGPAPWAPYCAARCHWNFRWNYDYSGGILTDWGMHIVDTAQWGNNTERTGPITVEGKGEFPASGIYNTATECHLEYTYTNGVKMFIETGGVGLRFEGTEGWVGNTGWIGPLEASSPHILMSIIGPEETHLYTCPGGEHRNFLDCVKTRRDPYFPAEIGHRCASVQHIGNAAMLLGRKLRWNPEKEEFINDDSANRMRSRAMRAPWSL